MIINNLLLNDRDIDNNVWTKIRKKPFIIKIKEILDNWNLPKDPNIEVVSYPIIPPWFNINNLVSIDLQTHTTKAMGPIQNHVSTVETVNNLYNDYLCIYTDGSKAVDNSTGAAFHVPVRDVTSQWRLQDASSIVSAELSALKKATDWLLFQNSLGKAVVLTDSKSSLFLILHRKPKVFAATVHNIHSNILKLIEKGWEVHFQWIPSHCNVFGYCQADRMARRATNSSIITNIKMLPATFPRLYTHFLGIAIFSVAVPPTYTSPVYTLL